ncbi:hypothetical protein EGR_04572 [Echinococcus granulosus]|uniref:Uncharacterized protein n=1 Tax=Echinococcus granulosus TaxID=6210 RepID=W6UHN1_ECHGR|nr:hypothetical protein EGR_04572 [Echinococcus granulosus]EUB60553.1 hypothetical protein EGR_04572 [Echinococcus granulosus]
MPHRSSSTECGSNRRRRWQWLTCLGCTSRCTGEVSLFHAIAQGDSEELERCLQYLQTSPILLTVRRGHPNKLLGTFFQECSPAIWAVECRQWHLLPLLSHYGYDINRPQLCRRWTCFCRNQLRPNNSPYRRLWTRGQYTYQSILDYFFASVYERIGEFQDTPLLLGSDFQENPLEPLLSHANELLSHGVDVHRIDSIIVFNSLASSFDRYMCHYFDASDSILPDIPKRADAFVELKVLQHLIENGFSEFEFMEYVSPNTNWFGILICLLAHPRLPKVIEANRPVPPLLRSAALLFINLLVWRHSFPTSIDLQDCMNNLRLRKTYIRRYADQQNVFTARVASIIRESDSLFRSPPTLGLLARNRIRGLLGGRSFKAKVASLGLPQNLATFLALVGPEHMAWIRTSPFIVAVATGKLTVASFEELDGLGDKLSSSLPPLQPPSPPTVEQPHPSLPLPPFFTEAIELESPVRCGTVKRRASACPRTNRLQPMTGPVLRIQRSMTAVVRGPRPSSAPLLKKPYDILHPLLYDLRDVDVVLLDCKGGAASYSPGQF